MAIYARTLSVFLALFCLALSLSGCHSAAPALLSAHAVSFRTASTTPPALTPEQTGIAHVQSLPLYQQAQAACQKHRYKDAADLLDRLARTSGLNDQEVAFCSEQRDLCLKDAGLPVSRQNAKPQSSDKEGRQEVQKPQKELEVASADCGPRALLLACQKLGLKANLQALRLTAGTTGKGTSLQGLAQAAHSIGLKAEGVQLSREALAEAQTPALAWINGNHFIAVLALHGSGESGTATVHDPNQFIEETISQEQLLRLCSGYLLLLHR